MKISRRYKGFTYISIVLIIILGQATVFAVSDYGNIDAQEYGDALYRIFALIDSVGYNYNHAGVFAGINSSDSERVIEAPVADNNPDNSFYSSFESVESDYYGAYTLSNKSLSFVERKAIVQVAIDLVAADKGYPLLAHDALTYWGLTFEGTIADIHEIRCDGVVEYCYEKNGHKVWWNENEPSTAWNISNDEGVEAHNNMPDLSVDPDFELSPWAQRGSPPNTGPYWSAPHSDNSYMTRSALIDLPTYEVSSWVDGDHMVVQVKAKDIKSGIHKIGYRLPGGSGWTYSRNVQHPSSDTYTQQYNIYSEGYFYYWAQDNGGNQPEYAEYVEVQFPIWYRDADGDGYGNPNNSIKSCSQPSGYVSNSTDCSDSDSSIHPGATEICDSKDNDCDGQIDEGAGQTWYRDADGDGYGNPNNSIKSCSQPSGYVSNSTDCSDNDSSVHPGATEVCDGKDNDCDGQIDEGLGQNWYRDADGDGYGNPNNSVQSCSQPSGYVSNSTDCSDSDSSIHPGATEICDSKDNDCDGQIDEGGSAPSAPTGVSASDGNYTDHIRVSWNLASGATGYEVWRNTSNNSGTAIKSGDYTSPYDDTSAVAGTTYWYWVKAQNSCGTSGFSSSDSGYASTNPKNYSVSITKCTVTASSKESSDKISFSGTMNATADDFTGTIKVTVDSNDIVNPCALTFPINGKTFKVKNGTYSYSGTENKLRKSFTYNVKTRKFAFSASNVDLSGLGCPVTIEIEIGDFNAADEIDEAVVNGPRVPIPILLMMGVKDVLRVDKCQVKQNNKKANSDQLSVKGAFAVEDTDANMTDRTSENLVVTLGTQKFTIPKNKLKAAKRMFSCSNVKVTDPNATAAATFNFNSCAFTLTIKNAEITAGAGDIVNFGVKFAGYNEVEQVTLP